MIGNDRRRRCLLPLRGPAKAPRRLSRILVLPLHLVLLLAIPQIPGAPNLSTAMKTSDSPRLSKTRLTSKPSRLHCSHRQYQQFGPTAATQKTSTQAPCQVSPSALAKSQVLAIPTGLHFLRRLHPDANLIATSTFACLVMNRFSTINLNSAIFLSSLQTTIVTSQRKSLVIWARRPGTALRGS